MSLIGFLLGSALGCFGAADIEIGTVLGCLNAGLSVGTALMACRGFAVVVEVGTG